MRKEQKFDLSRRYYKDCWEKVKKIQKLLREHEELLNLTIFEFQGDLVIYGYSLDDLHEIRQVLSKIFPWKDEIESKTAYSNTFDVVYIGKGELSDIKIRIEYPQDEIPPEVLGDCYIEKKLVPSEEYISNTVVCPVGR